MLVLAAAVLTTLASARAQLTSDAPADAIPTRAARSYAPYPQPHDGYVTDLAGVLSSDERDELNSWCYTAEIGRAHV